MLLEVIDISIVCLMYLALLVTPQEKILCQKIQIPYNMTAIAMSYAFCESFLNIRYPSTLKGACP